MSDADQQTPSVEAPVISLKGRWVKPTWCTANAVAMAVDVWLSKPLWAYHLEPGRIYASGPGDGFYFFFLLMIPWLLVMLVNAGVLIRVVVERAILGTGWIWTQVAILVAWLIIAVIEQRLLKIPEAVIRISS